MGKLKGEEVALNFNARIDEDITRIEFRDENQSIEIVNLKILVE